MPIASVLAPSVEVLTSYADDQICRAAAGLWPGDALDLGPVVPGVTSFVRSVSVGGRPLFAKVSFLGMSLVSVLRGSAGDWAAVEASQDAYLRGPGSLNEREAAHLALLRDWGVRVPRVAGYRSGVLFTEAVAGPTLADRLAADPGAAGSLVAAARSELQRMRRPGAVDLVQGLEIRERSVPAVFARKFNGLSGPAYLGQAGEWGPLLAGVVGRVRPSYRRERAESRVVLFGDFKPEHVVLPDGGDGRPVLLDPGLAVGPAHVDAAKLVSRAVLDTLASPSPSAGALVAVLGGFAEAECAAAGAGDRDVWLRRLVLVWLMDSVNILTTYLTCPDPGLLSARAKAVAASAGQVCRLLDAVSVLASLPDPAGVWESALGLVVKAVHA